jgi:proliferating cell nuclear antigen
MAKIMKCAGNDDVVTMKAEDSGDTITFMFESEKQTRISHFSLKLMDIDSEHLGIPEQDYQCVVQMPAQEFQRICKEITIIGDTVRLQANKEGVKFSVSGDMGTGSIVCKQNAAVDEEEDSVIIKVEEEMSLTFALRYLNFFAKATPLSKAVKLSMSPDVPLAVEYKVYNEEEAGDMGQLQFFLAPKIEEDEEQEGGAAKEEATGDSAGGGDDDNAGGGDE